ncbi:tyrosine-type recombinase/integrase [Amycolatopsis lurida]
MKGHVQDRWYRHKKDVDGKLMYTANGRPVREKTELYGKGLRYKVHYYDADGKERSKSYPDKAKNKAEDFLTKMQHDVLSGDFIDPNAGDVKFHEYAKEWAKGQSADAHTRQTVSSRLNNGIFPKLGDKPLRIVAQTSTIRDWLHWMETPESEGGRNYLASYRAQLFDLVSAILGAACYDKKIKSNPCSAKSIKRPKPDSRKIVPWPEERVHTVHKALPAEYKIVVPIGAGAGLRQMEIFGLSPDDVDRDNMMLHVRRQIRWIGRVPVFAPPKGGKTRSVPLGGGLLGEVDAYSAEFEPFTVTLPWLHPNGRPETVRLLIHRKRIRVHRRTATNPHDMISGGWFTNSVWTKAFADAGLTYLPRHDCMHGLRHFCASIWLANGVSIKEVAEYLGHEDPGFTLKIYTHLVPSSHARARAACDLVFPQVAAPLAA